jgi:hypothetical protein
MKTIRWGTLEAGRTARKNKGEIPVRLKKV